MSELLNAYRYWRRARYKAAAALAYARRDMVEGKRRYASSPWAKHAGNPAMSKGRAMWIEKPSSMGLRFVGYADEFAKLDYTGWFTNDFGDAIRGVVYQLPGRDGKARFVAAHDNADNGRADSDGPAYVDFSQIIESDFEDEMCRALASMGRSYWTPERLKPGYWAEAAHESARKEAARAADEFTRVQAERERAYNTAWEAGSQWADAGAEIAEIRESIKADLATRKAIRADMARAGVPMESREWSRACAMVRASVTSSLEALAELRDKRARLASGDHERLCFYPSPELRAAFNEGAGEAVL